MKKIKKKIKKKVRRIKKKVRRIKKKVRRIKKKVRRIKKKVRRIKKVFKKRPPKKKLLKRKLPKRKPPKKLPKRKPPKKLPRVVKLRRDDFLDAKEYVKEWILLMKQRYGDVNVDIEVPARYFYLPYLEFVDRQKDVLLRKNRFIVYYIYYLYIRRGKKVIDEGIYSSFSKPFGVIINKKETIQYLDEIKNVLKKKVDVKRGSSKTESETVVQLTDIYGLYYL